MDATTMAQAAPGQWNAAAAYAEPLLNEWWLKRNCALSPRQFLVLFVSLCSVSLTIAIVFLLRGAWMILPFTVLEQSALLTACVVHARHAIDYEHIRLFPNRLVVEQMHAFRITCHEFNPLWVRVEPGATSREPLTLHSAGKSVRIGQYLMADAREPFATELRAWLRRCG
ncbi:MAG: DUF2244 domain-containing protein [Janthinobacterium lividum]